MLAPPHSAPSVFAWPSLGTPESGIIENADSGLLRSLANIRQRAESQPA